MPVLGLKALAAAFLYLAIPIPIHAQSAQATVIESGPPQIVERGLNRRVIQRAVRETQADGRVVERNARYVEIAGGMHHEVNGQLVETEEKFALVPGGAVARGQHQVSISADFQAQGVVDLTSAEGHRFRSHLLGLAYTDMSTGQSVLIGEPQACAAELVAPNVVIFRDALSGPVRCDVRYTFTRGGFSQDLILRSRLSDPGEWGLDKAWTRVEVWSVVDAPEPTLREEHLVKPEEQDLPMFDAGMVDTTLQWGSLRLGPGRAFMLNDDEGLDVIVAKDLVELNQVRYLVEKVDYVDMEEESQKLPLAAVNAGDPAARQARVRHPSRNAALTAALRQHQQRRERQEAQATPAIQTASIQPAREEPGLVLDYQTVNVNLTSTVFRRDTTYFVVGNYTMAGTNVLEGSCVIKATNGSLVNRLTVTGTLICETDRTRPAILTSWQDDTVGETIVGSTGNPTNTCGAYLDFTGNSTSIDLHDLRVRHAYVGMRMNSSSQVTIRHSQFSSNYIAAGYGPGKFRNVLVHDGTYGVGGQGTWTFENVTFHRLQYLRSTPGTNSLYLTYATNCLVLAATNYYDYFGAYNVRDASSTGYFQSAGSAAHYLIAGSTNRDVATTNIDATLLADLRKLTTWPPLVLTNHFTNDTVLAPQAPRDTDGLDLGYHPPPLDYCWTALKVSNARLTLTNDVAIGLYGSSSSYGIGLDSGGELVSMGQPHRRARILRNNLAQEHASGAWSASSVAPLVRVLTNGPAPPKLYYRFTESLLPAGFGEHLNAPFQIDDEVFGFRDSVFASGNIYSTDIGLALTNCVVDRVFLEIEGSANDMWREFRHNLFRGGTLWVSLPSTVPVTAKNNLFDRTTITQSGDWTHGWNGYYTNQATGQHLTNSAVTDKFLTSAGYETGPLGWYYYPTNGGAGTLTDLVNPNFDTRSGFQKNCAPRPANFLGNLQIGRTKLLKTAVVKTKTVA